MTVSPEQARIFFERLYDLDMQTAEGCERYKSLRREFVGQNEGYDGSSECATSLCGVYEVLGVKHVGVGFNMERPEAKKEWELTFPSILGGPGFDKVFNGEEKLSKRQIEQLLDSGLEMREHQLRNIYGDTWDGLKANERLAIEDMYFNTPKIAGGATRFSAFVKEYATTGDAGCLDKALCEVRFHSNPKGSSGIEDRRIAETILLNTYDRSEKIMKAAHDEVKEKKTSQLDSIPSHVRELAMQAVQTDIGVKIATETELPRHDLANVVKPTSVDTHRTS